MPRRPPIATATFTVSPASIAVGQSATLTWATTGAKTVSISSIGSVSRSGSMSVAPTASLSYTLTAKISAQQAILRTVTLIVTAVVVTPPPTNPPTTDPPVPPPIPPPPSVTVGPRAITQPTGSVSIPLGTSIQTAINNAPAGTAFWLPAGVRSLTASLNVKNGNQFFGELGAILDGSSWVTSNVDAGAFVSQGTTDVVIDNLVIRNMPQKGISGENSALRWTVSHLEVQICSTGIALPSASTASKCHIHHCRTGGYSAFRCTDPSFLDCEIAYNGPEQKIVSATNPIIRGCYFHHNAWNAGWFDSNNTNWLFDTNICEDNGGSGLVSEISYAGTTQHNIYRRNGDCAVFIVDTQNVTVLDETCEDNFRGIQLYINTPALLDGYDLKNITITDCTVRVPSTAGAFASMLSHNSNADAGVVAPYLAGLKNLTWVNTAYTVPNVAAPIFVWGFGQLKTWTQWQGSPILQDLTGSIA